jgi:hypothetical protein
MKDYIKARTYLNMNYKKLMSLFSSLYTQIESEDNDSVFKLSAKTAYYTVVSHNFLKDNSSLSKVEEVIMNKGSDKLTPFDHELAVCLIVEGRMHNFEIRGFIKVRRNKAGETTITLTKKGKEKGINLNADLYRNL